MAGGFGEFVVVYDLLPEIAEKLEQVMTNAVNKAAFDIQATAQSLAPVGPTGFLKNSIYVEVGEEGSEPNLHPYENIQEPQEGQEALPQIDKPKKHQAAVAVAANYGVFVEFGTVHMSPRPYLEPAIAAVAPSFLMALEKLEAEMEAL